MTGASAVPVHRKETREKREQQRHERNQLQEHERDEEYQGYKESDSYSELIMKANLWRRGS